MAGRPILRRTCAQPIKIRVIPENEIPRALHVDIYCTHSFRNGIDTIRKRVYNDKKDVYFTVQLREKTRNVVVGKDLIRPEER